MSLIRYPANDNRKTSSSEVDQQFSQKVTAVKWLSFIDAEGISRNIVDGTTLEYTSSTVISDEGPVSQFNGSQQGRVLLPSLLDEGTGRGLLVCARIKATAVQPNSHGCAFGVFNDGGPSQFGFGVGYDTANNIGASVLHDNAAALTARSPALQDKWYTVFVRCLSVGTTYNLYAWIDGVPATIDQGVTQTGGNGPLTEVAIGAQHRSTGYLRFFIGQVAWAAVLNVVEDFNDQDALLLFNDGFPFTAISNEKGYALNVDPYVEPQKAKIRYAPVRNKQPSSSVDVKWNTFRNLESVWHPPAKTVYNRSTSDELVSTDTTSFIGENGIAVEIPFFTSISATLLPTTSDGTAFASYNFVVEVENVSTVFSRTALVGSSSATGTPFSLCLTGNGSSLLLEAWVGAGFSGQIASFNITSPGLYVIGFSFRQSGLAKLYVNGQNVSTVNAGTFCRARVQAMVAWSPGEPTLATRGVALLLNAVGFISEVQEAEFISLYNNPWQLFDAADYALNVDPYVEPQKAKIRYAPVRNKQPSSSVGIDWTNPLSFGLVAALPASRMDSDAVAGLPVDSTGTNTTVTNVNGIARKYENAGLRWEITPSSLESGVTLLTVSVARSTSQIDLGVTIFSSDDNFYPSYETGAFRLFRRNGGSFPGASFTSTLETGKSYVVVGVQRNSALRELYVDGALVATNTTNVTRSHQFYRVGTNYGETGVQPASFFPATHEGPNLYLVWNRALSSREIEEISANPWQLFDAAEYTLNVDPYFVAPKPLLRVNKSRKNQPQSQVEVNPKFDVFESWLPGITSKGLVIGSQPSVEATFSVNTTPSGLGLNVTATGRRYDQEFFNSQSAYAWLIVAYRDGSAQTTNQSVLRKDGVVTPLQESIIQTGVRAGVWPAGALRLGLYETPNGTDISNFYNKVTVFAGLYTSEGLRIYCLSDGQIRSSVVAESIGGLPSNTNPLTFGSSETGGEVATAWTNLSTTIWQGKTPDPVVLQDLMRDNWRLYTGKYNYVPYGTSGSLIPILLALAPTNVSLSTFRPRYQLTY